MSSWCGVAAWSCCVQPDRQISSTTSVKKGEAVPFVRQILTCRHTCRCGTLWGNRSVRALVRCGQFYVAQKGDYCYCFDLDQGSGVSVRAQSPRTRRAATLAVLRGPHAVLGEP